MEQHDARIQVLRLHHGQPESEPYIGFTSDLQGRVWQHKNGVFEGYSKTNRCHRLVYYEFFQYANNGLARERQLKNWSRAKKIALIRTKNPAWTDLAEEWGKPVEPFREPKA